MSNTRKTRVSKLSTTDTDMNAFSKLELESLKLKNEEQARTIQNQNKNLDSLRSRNVEFAKNAETQSALVKSLNTRLIELTRDSLIAKANYCKLEMKVDDIRNVSLEMRKIFVNGTKYALELDSIIERTIDGDLTLGRDDQNTSASTFSKSPMKAVQPMISGHIIQNPTISISKSDSQQINFIIQHQNDIRNDSNQQNGSHLNNSPISFMNIATNSSIDNLQPTLNGSICNISNREVENDENQNESEEIENTTETDNACRRLSTISEISTLQSTIENNTMSNTLLPGPNSSRNSANSTNSSNKSKRRASRFLSPIETFSKISKSGYVTHRNKSNHSSCQNSISSIGMSTRGSSSGLNSSIMAEDPMEGPSTLLDNDNSSFILNVKNTIEDQPITSTPMDSQKRIGKKSVNRITTVLSEFVTTRKIKGNPKTSQIEDNNENSDKVNLSKSLNDLSDLDNTVVEINKLKASRIKKRTKINTSLFPEPSETSKEQNNTSPSESVNKTSPKKNVPPKKGRPKKLHKNSEISKRKSVKRKSRSCSPTYRLENTDSNSPEIPISNNTEGDLPATSIASSINPTVNLERLPEPRRAKNKRRSRSLSPQGSEKSGSSGVSTRSSGRVRHVINYNEPSLKVKVRRK